MGYHILAKEERAGNRDHFMMQQPLQALMLKRVLRSQILLILFLRRSSWGGGFVGLHEGRGGLVGLHQQLAPLWKSLFFRGLGVDGELLVVKGKR